MRLEFSGQILLKMVKCQILMKIRLVGAELFRSDGRTDGRT